MYYMNLDSCRSYTKILDDSVASRASIRGLCQFDRQVARHNIRLGKIFAKYTIRDDTT